MFNTLDYNLILLYFIALIAQALAIGSSLIWPLCHLTYHHPCGLLLNSTTTCYRLACLFPASSSPSWTNSPRIHGSSYWKILVKTLTWVLDPTEASLLLSLFSWQREKTCIYPSQFLYAYLYVFLYVTIFIYMKLNRSSYWCLQI